MTTDNPQKNDLGTLGRDENSLQRKLCSDEQLITNQLLRTQDSQSCNRAADRLRDPKSRVQFDLGPWQRFVAEFAELLTVEGYSRHTVKLYQRAATRFTAWMNANSCAGPAAITAELCLAYQRAVYYHRDRNGKGLASATQVQWLNGARVFTRFLKRRGYALVDAGLAIQLPRAPKRLPRGVMTEEEVTKLLSTPDVRTLRGYRDRTIIEVLYATGIRSGELAGLDVEDVDAAAGRLRIRSGKGNKDRWVPLGSVAAEYLAGYIRTVRPKLARRSAEKALFLQWNGKRMSGAGLSGELRKYIHRAGIEWRVVPHSFRHTCATHMLKHGANLRHIQEMLGHASLETTERYTRVEISDLAAVHERFHPREQL